MGNSIIRPLILGIALLQLFSNSNLYSQEKGWTHFRGSNLDGISNNTGTQSIWNDSTNVTWKTEIHGKAWSSPVVLNNQIWVTTATEDGTEMFALCIDYKSGEIIHDIKLFEPDTVYRKHGVNTYATPTPCIEDGFVYVHFGRYGTACLSTETGQVIWKRTDLECNHVQGPGSSSIRYKNMLILHYQGTDERYITALNKTTGEEVWRTDRPNHIYDHLEPIGKKAYITPLIININGKDIMISNGSAVTIAYDPNTGKELWRIVKGEDSTISMPSHEDGIVYFYTGFVKIDDTKKVSYLMAVNPEGKGDIADTHIIWQKESPILQLSTQLVIDGYLYTIDTKSILWCLDAKTGEEIWSKKLRGKFNSSPILVDGKIYFSSTKGTTFVINHREGDKIISENKLEGDIWATPAIYNSSILIRTSKFLYRID
jgi:outer membrane protein assembly factor BamB